MCRTTLLLSFVLLNTCMTPVLLKADETFSADETKEPPVSVQCHGLLRHGVVSIGGETTGTTISFHRITWELQLTNDDDREFAAQHHKKSVLVTGALRKVMSTENMTRWIIDVGKITPPETRDAKPESVQIIVRGTLRAALSTGDVPDFSVRTKDQNWRLDFSASREIQTAAELLIGQSVLLTGTVLPPPEEVERTPAKPRTPQTLSIRVKTIEPSDNGKSDAKFFE